MGTSNIKTVHTAPVGSHFIYDDTEYAVIYHDSYLDEALSVLESFGSDEGRLAVIRDDSICVYKKYVSASENERICPYRRVAYLTSARIYSEMQQSTPTLKL